MKDLEWLLAYNDFQHDPFSQNNSCKAIACRNDLQPNVTVAYPFGAIDTKISSVGFEYSHDVSTCYRWTACSALILSVHIRRQAGSRHARKAVLILN